MLKSLSNSVWRKINANVYTLSILIHAVNNIIPLCSLYLNSSHVMCYNLTSKSVIDLFRFIDQNYLKKIIKYKILQNGLKNTFERQNSQKVFFVASLPRFLEQKNNDTQSLNRNIIENGTIRYKSRKYVGNRFLRYKPTLSFFCL